jgi:putative intracellular protease/amidase
MHIVPLIDQFTALDAVGPYEVPCKRPDAEAVLATAGLLDGLDATTHWAAVDELETLRAFAASAARASITAPTVRPFPWMSAVNISNDNSAPSFVKGALALRR